MSTALNYIQIDSVLKKHQDFFAHKAKTMVENFWNEVHPQNQVKPPSVKSNETSIHIGDDYLKKSINFSTKNMNLMRMI